MATARAIASLNLSFGLVSIPVKLYSATDSAASVRFNMLAKDGSRLKQQYVSAKDGSVVERADMVKGYEFEKDRFVLFTPDELKALDEASDPTIDIVSFVPQASVDPIYYDKAYLLAPDKRGGKPYALLAAAMRDSGRCALARWRWKGRQYVVQIRGDEDGLVLQQLLYANEVRSLKDLGIEPVSVSQPELELALQLIDQIAEDAYDPAEFNDDEKERVLAAIDAKIAGKQVVASEAAETAPSAQVIDLMAALRASLGSGAGKTATNTATKTAATMAKASKPAAKAEAAAPAAELKERKAARRTTTAAKPAEADAEPAPARARARK